VDYPHALFWCANFNQNQRRTHKVKIEPKLHQEDQTRVCSSTASFFLFFFEQMTRLALTGQAERGHCTTSSQYACYNRIGPALPTVCYTLTCGLVSTPKRYFSKTNAGTEGKLSVHPLRKSVQPRGHFSKVHLLCRSCKPGMLSSFGRQDFYHNQPRVKLSRPILLAGA
jgi:hypothetical protein